jgi:hypothetical protein
MKPNAVHQAYERLERARTAAAPLADPNREFGRLRIDWSDFIMAANAVYTKLEQGSKGNKKSESWFAMQKHKRRKDPLMRYLRAARNSDEHTLEVVAGVGVSATALHESVAVKVDGAGMHIDFEKGNPPPLPGTDVAQIKFGFYPLPVTDTRFNERFVPPASHLGQPVTEPTAATIATLALDYLERMIAEAAALPA